jgi:nucleotide-binding universal stress UspA family protein
MSASVSHKLDTALEGALAGGGDPATSPLYVFTPFLKLIMLGAASGVAGITFGPSVWLVVLTVGMVSLMYRLVMQWVTDGSGGSGLSEEEFGGWAVKTNAAITYIEYTLTFLVSMAAMVTFVADRFPMLNETIGGVQFRALLAVALSILTGWLVNRGPKTAAKFFGPATMAVLGLLWIMVFSTLWQHVQAWMGNPSLMAGVGVLPGFDLRAFSLTPTAPGEPSYLAFTLGGYARILAVMTGIEVFANLVAAYSGKPREKASKAFGSLVIIMGTTGITMLIVGPAIFHLADPANNEVSVFTQTMDLLLPGPLAYLGTLVGVAVLLSASAASAEGIQNLSLGLTTRRYVPPLFGRLNRFGVAPMPVWIEVAICCLLFLFVGTSEETYLAIYAAGVFILLSMTGWASTQRLIRELGSMGRRIQWGRAAALISSAAAAVLTTIATFIIFRERFFDGAWTFLVLIPVLYTGFTYFHAQMGEPGSLVDRLGGIQEAALGGFGPNQSAAVVPPAVLAPIEVREIGLDRPADAPPKPAVGDGWRTESRPLRRIVLPLDGSDLAETALPMAVHLADTPQGRLRLLNVMPPSDERDNRLAGPRRRYLEGIVASLDDRLDVAVDVVEGPVARAILDAAHGTGADAIVMASLGRTGVADFRLGSVSRKVVHMADLPTIIVRSRRASEPPRPSLERILVVLDGSAFAERVLPFAVDLHRRHGSELVLLRVPEIPQAVSYGALADLVAELRRQAEVRAEDYIRGVLTALAEDGITARGLVGGMGPAATIAEQADRQGCRMIMLTTNGRSGIDGMLMGSVASRVVRHAEGAIFMLPIRERGPKAADRSGRTDGAAD